ncbi:MAG: DMT family transporter [Rhodobacterales bacterium]|nr:DMT family transporter [Rhodobacterales bacterium]
MNERTAIAEGRTRRAILTICAGVAFLASNDAIAKLLVERYDPIQVVFFRNLIALPMVGAVVVYLQGWTGFRTAHLRIHAMRGLLMLGGAYTFFKGLEALALAEATALVFSAPIFITALSVPLLGETVGWRRWLAVLVGFVGVLIIVQPGAAAFQPASLFVIGTAVLYALFMISARWLGPRETMWTMMFYVMLFPMLYAAPFAAAVWVPISLGDLPFFVLQALLGALGITLIGQAFRLAPAAVVAPFDYTALIWASLLGWLIWADTPGFWTLVGASVIVVSGIFIVWRESRQPG